VFELIKDFLTKNRFDCKVFIMFRIYLVNIIFKLHRYYQVDVVFSSKKKEK